MNTDLAPGAREELEAKMPGLSSVPIVGIVRRLPPNAALDAIGVAVEEGLKVVEVTLDSENPFDLIAETVDSFPSVTVGAGTVLSPREVEEAAGSGARFIVSPIVQQETIERAVTLGLGVVPGAVTPTEIAHAVALGATAVKVFPAGPVGGAGYLSALMAPLRSPLLIPTGGVSSATAPEYLAAGAVAVGAGSDLFSSKALQELGLEAIGERARAWVRSVGGMAPE